MTALDAVAAEVRAWYDGYLDAFTRVATEERADLAPLLEFYAVPLVMATAERQVALPTPEAVLDAAQALLKPLRRAGYGGGTVRRLEVRPLNARAALIEGGFSRHDRAGAVFEQIGVVYLVVKTEADWRISAVVATAPESAPAAEIARP